MDKTVGNVLRMFICAVFTVQLIGCGTLMYPERRGQRGGSIDAGVAILDGIGLLFGILPGVIAFAVDFSNGTIYLPTRTKLGYLDFKDIKAVKFDPKSTSLASLEMIIKDKTGREVRFDQDNIKLTKLRSVNDVYAQFAKADPAVQDDRKALI